MREERHFTVSVKLTFRDTPFTAPVTVRVYEPEGVPIDPGATVELVTPLVQLTSVNASDTKSAANTALLLCRRDVTRLADASPMRRRTNHWKCTIRNGRSG